MNSLYGGGGFGKTPPVVKNLLIINVLLLFANYVFQGIDLIKILGIYYPASDHFSPYQFITHMFVHAGFAHLFFNMFALWMFGRVLESVWGNERFLFYFLFTGIGASLLHIFVQWLQISSIENPMIVQQLQNIPTVGASGAVFGILLAFGMLFPNAQLMLLFPPIPIKAKYFVIGYGVIELFLGISQPGSSVAHFAHVGGMLFGLILIKYWDSKGKRFG